MSIGFLISLFQAHLYLVSDKSDFFQETSCHPDVYEICCLILFTHFFFRPIIYCPIPCRMAIRLLPGLLPNFYYFCCVSSIGPTVHSLISFGATTALLSGPPLNHCQSLHLISNSHLFDLYKNNYSISALH